MKILIISDLHLGDPNSTLIKSDLTFGSKFSDFLDAAGTNDYLVLLGDAFDFSVSAYDQVYAIARIFLQQIRDHNIARQIIFVPGNHDFEFWHILEHEVNIINRIKEQQEPRGFRWSVPGVIDDRKGEGHKFSLPDVAPSGNNSNARYGDIFLSELVRPRLIFNVAYPNLYLITQSGECVLLTHGHYLEPYWSLCGEWALEILGESLEIDDPEKKQLSLKEMVALNFPLNQLASSGMGQAGVLTPVLRQIQQDAKEKRFDRIQDYLNNLDDNILDKEFIYSMFDPREWISDIVIDAVKGNIIKKLKKMKLARYDEHFMEHPKPRERLRKYYCASLKEMERLKNLPPGWTVDIPQPPERIIFGHTHQPIAWEDKRLYLDIDHTRLFLHNSGGWLMRKKEGGTEVFFGAALFFYQTGVGFSTVKIT